MKKNFSRLGFLGLIVLIFAASIVSACKRRTTSTSASGERVLVFARPGDSVGLDLARQEDGESINVGTNILETLVRFKAASTEIEPCLAEKWDISKDGLQYTFYLRKNVQFTDGTPLNADAVVFSIERQMNQQHPAYASGAPYKYWDAMGMSDIVKSIQKVDDTTVTFELKLPNAPFLANVAMPFMSVVSPAAYMKDPKAFDQRPVGTGPYVLDSWKKDDAMTLVANNNYWGGKPTIQKVVVRVIPDNSVRMLELQKGAVHIMEFPNPSDIEKLEADPQIKLLKQEGMNIGYLAYHTKKAPFDRVEVRQALSMAVNRQRILDEIYHGMGAAAKNVIPPFMLGYNDQVPQVEYNPEKAKELLAKAGHSNLSLKLWAMPVARPYNPNARKMAEFIQADYKKIGVNVEIVSYDWGTYLDKVGKGEHELVLLGWQGDNGDSDNFLYPLWSKDSAMKIPTQNYSFYSNDQVNEWLLKAQRSTNVKERAQLYKQVLVQMSKDLPVLPIAHSMMVVPTRKEVEGYQIQPTGDRRFFTVKFADDSNKASF